MEEDAEIQKILQHELISPQEKEKALGDLLPRLLSRKSEEIIVSMVPEYQRLLDEERDVEPVEVTLASEITPALESELKQRLAPVSYTHLDVYKRQMPPSKPPSQSSRVMTPR